MDIGGDTSNGNYASSVTAEAGSISITGFVNSGPDNTKEAGIALTDDAQISASGTGGTGATAQGDITLDGETTGSTAQSLNGGVFIDGAGTLVSASGTTPDASGNTGLTITGISTGIDGTAGETIDRHDDNTGGVFLEPVTSGIALIDGAEIMTTSAVTLNGTSGTNASTLNSTLTPAYTDPTTGETSGSYGVAIFSPQASQTTTLSAGGNLSITGQAGSSPTTGVGVLVGGTSNVGAVSITSGGSILLNGTGGAGNAGDTGEVANAGVAIFNPGNATGTVTIAANGGGLSLVGTAGTGGLTGVDLNSYFGPGTGGASGSIDPGLSTTGTFSVLSNTGAVQENAPVVTAVASTYTTPVGTTSSIQMVGDGFGPLSLNGGAYNVSAGLDPLAWSLSTSSLTDLTLTGGSYNGTNDDINITGPVTADNLTLNGVGAINVNAPINATGNVTLLATGGDITLASTGSITDTGSGNNVVVAAGDQLSDSYYIINNSSTGIQVANGSTISLYSSDPTSDTLGGLTFSPTDTVYNATYAPSATPADSTTAYYVAASGDTGPNSPTGGTGTGGTGTGGTGTGGTGTGGTGTGGTGTGGTGIGVDNTGGSDDPGSNLAPPSVTPQPPEDRTGATARGGG